MGSLRDPWPGHALYNQYQSSIIKSLTVSFPLRLPSLLLELQNMFTEQYILLLPKALFQTYWNTRVGVKISLKYCQCWGSNRCPLAWELGTLPLDQLDLVYYHILDRLLWKNISSNCESLKDWRPLRPLRPPSLLLELQFMFTKYR